MTVTPQGGVTASSLLGAGRQDPIDMARRHRVELLSGIHDLERAIAAPVSDPQWRARASARLAGLRVAFTEHVALTEGDSGLYAELLTAAPRLARTVRVLVREHAMIRRGLDSLAERLADPGIESDQLRGWANDLVRELSRHRQRGADLVYEAYATDIGGET